MCAGSPRCASEPPGCCGSRSAHRSCSSRSPASRPGGGWRNVATYPLAIGWVWVNRTIPALWVIGLGAVCNLLPILANGGVMPASARALQVAGLSTPAGVFANSTVVPDPKLLFLGDVIAIPSAWPLANVLSVGDVVIALGAGYTIHRVTGSRLAGRPRPVVDRG